MQRFAGTLLASLLALGCGRSQASEPGSGDGERAPGSRGEPHVTMVEHSPYRLHPDGMLGVTVAGADRDSATIVRLATSGAVDWSLDLATGADYRGLEGGALDEAGNYYAAGAFQGTFSLAGVTLESVVNPGPLGDSFDPRGRPSRDVYLLKLSRGGKLVWIKQFGGVADQQVLGLARAPDGTLALVLSFTGRVDVDGQSFLSSGGATIADLLLVRLTSEGDLLHARALPVPLPRLAAACFDHAGALYLGGRAADARAFAALAALPEAGYLLKLDANFEPVWLLATDDERGPDVRGIAVDSTGAVVLATDGYGSTRQFGVEVGQQSIGFAKLDGDGNLLWSRSFGANRLDHASAVSVLSDDGIALTGSFYDVLDFGGGELVPLEPDGFTSDVFVARFDAEGTHLGSLQLAGLDSDWSFGVTALPDDGVIVTGFTASGFSLGDAPVSGSGRTYVAWLGDAL